MIDRAGDLLDGVVLGLEHHQARQRPHPLTDRPDCIPAQVERHQPPQVFEGLVADAADLVVPQLQDLQLTVLLELPVNALAKVAIET